MLRAAVEAMVDVRMKARKIGMDPWAMKRLQLDRTARIAGTYCGGSSRGRP
jgi:hypothetical protein